MSKIYKLPIQNNNFIVSVQGFLKGLLREKIVDALLVQRASVNGSSFIHALIEKEDSLDGINPFAPLLLTNSATIVSQLTRDNPNSKLGAVLRSCEIRAVIELAKLKQINTDNLVIIGVDCLGTYESKKYQELGGKLDESNLRLACRTCEYPAPTNSDIAINFIGCDTNKEIFIQVGDEYLHSLAESLNLAAAGDSKQWRDASNKLCDKRIKARDELFKEVNNTIKEVKDFLKELEHCRRCYNCRRECPICYCRECIFDSLTFEHNSNQYFDWAKRKGKIRMPTDTLLFHLTRMNHMAVSCVGCGQCTSACPNGIEIAKFFKTIGYKVQKLFEYEAGRSLDEENPQATFKEDEFPEIGESA